MHGAVNKQEKITLVNSQEAWVDYENPEKDGSRGVRAALLSRP